MRVSGVDIVTFGQYLRPTKNHLPVKRYVEPKEFDEWKKIGEDMKKKQKSIKINLIMNTIKTLMSLIFPLITFPYASRILGATGIGRVNYASSIVSYFSMFAALGISTYAVREGARIRDDKEKFSKFSREMLNINLCTTFIAYCALAVF